MGLYKNTNGVLTPVAGGTLYADEPIGTILPFGGSSIPNGFLLCDGIAVSRSTYADLFAVIGTAFGSGDGSTTFNIPDLRESTVKGVGLTGKSSNHMDSDGLALGEFIDDRIQTHKHRIDSDNNAVGTANCSREGGSIRGAITPSGAVVDARSGVTTEVKAIGVNFIIKATSVALPSDFASAVDNKISDSIVDSVADGNLKAVTSNAVYDFLKVKTKIISEGTTIQAGRVATVNDATLANKIFCGYSIYNVAQYNIAVTQALINNSGANIVIKNNGSSDITTGSITVYYMG